MITYRRLTPADFESLLAIAKQSPAWLADTAYPTKEQKWRAVTPNWMAYSGYALHVLDDPNQTDQDDYAVRWYGAFDGDVMQGWAWCHPFVKRYDGPAYVLNPSYFLQNGTPIDQWDPRQIDLYNYIVQDMRGDGYSICYPMPYYFATDINRPALHTVPSFVLSTAKVEVLDTIPANANPLNLLWCKYLVRHPLPMPVQVVRLTDAGA